MKKIEMIWRELLYQTLKKGNNRFTQKGLAQQFGFSTSTVFQALKNPRKMGAIQVGGRNFTLQDPEKLLYHWASVRNLGKDIIYQTNIDLPVLEIEGCMVAGGVFACFSAYRLQYDEAPADYDQVWVYSDRIEEIKKRFPFKKGRPNLIILNSDKYLDQYGQTTCLPQTFVDLWNLSDWYAKEYVNALKRRIDDLLS